MSDAGGGVAVPDTAIDPTTLAAYRETDYRVHADLGRGVDSSACVTACNPLGRPLDADANARLHAALVRTLLERGLDFLEGVGRHPSNGWPGETSCLVFGLSRETTTALGEELRQNAVLWCDPDAVPRLLLLR